MSKMPLEVFAAKLGIYILYIYNMYVCVVCKWYVLASRALGVILSNFDILYLTQFSNCDNKNFLRNFLFTCKKHYSGFYNTQ